MNNLIEKYVQIWNTQKTDELVVIFSEDAIYSDVIKQGNAVETLSKSIKDTAKAFPNISFKITSFFKCSKGEKLAMEWQMTGTNTGSFFGAEPTNNDINVFGVDIIKVADKKILSIKSYYDSGIFDAQLGADA